MGFIRQLEIISQKNNSLLCIGLDSALNIIPIHLRKQKNPLFTFNKLIIESTHDLVCSYKPNIAFYAALGIEGLSQLKQTIDYIHEKYPEIPVILDAKRGDVPSTALQYALEAFESLDADAVTVNPYLGFDSVEPFLMYKNKGVIVLCRTSNPGAFEFQDLFFLSKNDLNLHVIPAKAGIQRNLSGSPIKVGDDNNLGLPFYLHVAKQVSSWHKKYKNCLMVVGATWPEQLKEVRNIAPDMWFLVPGVGSQGGDLEKTVINGLKKDGSGLIINASRSILYAGTDKDFAEKARKEALILRDTINKYR